MRLLALRKAGVAGGLLAIFLLAGWLGYRAYLASPEMTSVPPVPAAHPARARQAVLFVIDGFNPIHAFDPTVMPTLARLATEGASGLAHTGPVTTTAPCVFSLMTGRPGNLVQAIFNFDASETRVDSVISLVGREGGRIVLGGDPAWHRQFGWIVPEADRLESPEPGISLDPHILEEDGRAVDFMLAKLADPAVTFAVVHLGAADAAGHKVTPLAPEYQDVLRGLDAILARVVARMDREHSLLIVTGDHGMASRGTHGGEEEARLTPYVLVGPHIRAGVREDVPQTAFSSTLSALLGLPFLPVSEHPPLVQLMDLPEDETVALTREYFASKARAAHTLVSSIAAESTDNDQLNYVLFGANDARLRLRVVFALVAMAGVLGGSLVVWWSIPVDDKRPPAFVHLGLALAVPIALAVGAEGFIALRSLFPLASKTLALVITAGLGIGGATAGVIAFRTPQLQVLVRRWCASLFFPAIAVLSIPMVNSHWLTPTAYFGALLIGVSISLVLGGARLMGGDGDRRMALVLPVSTGALLVGSDLSGAPGAEGLLLPALSIAVTALGVWNLWQVPGVRGRVAVLLVCLAIGSAWLWRVDTQPVLAALVLALFVCAIVAAAGLVDHPGGAAALLIVGSVGLFLVVAADANEASVFLLAAVVALVVARVRFDLSPHGALYVVAGVAILVRLVLFFELGDQYMISSIRTAPGMVLVSQGLPLATVASILLLKYALPWLLILGAVLPSLQTVGAKAVSHVLDLLALGYVARFALVAAVIDPCRILPNGMDGIVGMFCVSWAELITFGIAAIVLAVVVGSGSGARRAPA